ncbi:hypothetical protein CDCA_CDCA20G4760 [Cyanidium caldarium]|uniref:Uncharacterized protein n=1 Tax=Cyanidium caldarium TaxID=2771 RepID=A0AAV9J2Y2_CYACA|nr:hypothetical protein CDCA_CDCA20G4760 [Cyanidium caldarium]
MEHQRVSAFVAPLARWRPRPCRCGTDPSVGSCFLYRGRWRVSSRDRQPSVFRLAAQARSAPRSTPPDTPSPAPNATSAGESADEVTIPETISPRAMTWRAYLRAHKSLLRAGAGFGSAAAATCRKNDTARLFVPVAELDSYQYHSGFPGVAVARAVVLHADEIVAAGLEAARVDTAAFADKSPADLTPAEAVEEQLAHDLRAQLRIISYAALTRDPEHEGRFEFLHPDNVQLTAQLYAEMDLDERRLAAGWQAMCRKIQSVLPDPQDYPQRVQPAVDELLHALLGKHWPPRA